MDLFFPLVFVLFLLATIVWLFHCRRLFALLEARHREKYEAMHTPDLTSNSTFSGSAALLKFLFRREWEALDDPALDALCRRLRVLFVVCVLAFASLLLSIPLGLAP